MHHSAKCLFVKENVLFSNKGHYVCKFCFPLFMVFAKSDQFRLLSIGRMAFNVGNFEKLKDRFILVTYTLVQNEKAFFKNILVHVEIQR